MATLSVADGPVIRLSNVKLDPLRAGDAGQHTIILNMLNALLSRELIGVLRHQRHHDMARDLHALYTSRELLDRADDNRRHADMLIQRITDLGGVPDLSPTALHDCQHTQLIENTTISSLVFEDVIAQCDAIDDYRNLIKYLGDQDPATCRILAVILALEQQNKGEFARKIVSQCALD